MPVHVSSPTSATCYIFRGKRVWLGRAKCLAWKLFAGLQAPGQTTSSHCQPLGPNLPETLSLIPAFGRLQSSCQGTGFLSHTSLLLWDTTSVPRILTRNCFIRNLKRGDFFVFCPLKGHTRFGFETSLQQKRNNGQPEWNLWIG